VSEPLTPATPPNGPLSLSERVRSLRLPDKVDKPAPRAPWLPWALCALLALSTGLLAIKAFSSPPATDKVAASDRQESNSSPASKEATTAESAAGTMVHRGKGYVVPVHQITVSPKVGGMILKLNIVEGQRVQKGDILAQLETIEYDSDYQNARGVSAGAWQRWLELASGNRQEEIEQARAELEENEANRQQYYLDWKRSVDLKRGQVLSPKDYEQAYSLFQTTDRKVERLRLAYNLMLEGARVERLDAAWSDVVQAEANLAKAKWRLDNCTVLAPVTGTILTKKTEEGSIVNTLSFNIAASICDMADLSDLEIDLAIAERDIHRIFQGQKCELFAEAYPDRIYPGYVSRLMPTADQGKGAVPVRVKVLMRDTSGKFALHDDGEGKFLRPNMGAIVRFLNVSANPPKEVSPTR
jgi:HlyD family secretion protein